MRKTAFLTIIGIIVAICTLSTSLYAQGQGKGKREGMNRQDRVEMMKEKLDLSADQESAIKKMHLQHQKEMQVLRLDMQQDRLSLRQEMIKDNPNESEIDKIAERIGEREAEVVKKRSGHHLAIRNLLNEEQRAIFDTMAMHKMKKMHAHRRMHGGPGNN